MVPDLFGQPEDLTIYNDLLNEIQNSGVDQEKLWQLWHNDSHLIGKSKYKYRFCLQNFSILVKSRLIFFEKYVFFMQNYNLTIWSYFGVWNNYK